MSKSKVFILLPDGKIVTNNGKNIKLTKDTMWLRNDGVINYQVPDTKARREIRAKHTKVLKEWAMEYTLVGFDKDAWDESNSGLKDIFDPNYKNKLAMLINAKYMDRADVINGLTQLYGIKYIFTEAKRILKEKLTIYQPETTKYIRIEG